MLEKIKIKYLSKQNAKLRQKSSSRSVFDGRIDRIGFIVDNDKQSDFTEMKYIQRELAELFKLDENDVWPMEWIAKAKHNDEDENWFSCADFTWNGRLNYNNLKKFVNSDIDVLINLQNTPNLYLSNVNLLSKAKLKAGLKVAELDGLDFELAGDKQDKKLLFSELEKYILRFK